ncbi:hypothetical protein EV178_000011 [Coemansia sp. RSA 1646]|nr:hypothetical protein EV178_000011 [Coemansia sp. RSA 1646]
MLGIGHIERKERKATPTSMVDRSTYRQSWSSDEPSSSSNSVKDTKSLWSKLRRQASRMHVSQSTQSNRSSINYQQGSFPYIDKKRAYSSPHTAKPMVTGTPVSVERPLALQPSQQHRPGAARNSMTSWSASTDEINAKSSEASIRHQSLVPGLERLKSLSVLGSETNVSILRHDEKQMREPASLAPTLPSNKPRSNSYLGAANAQKMAPAMTRVSTDVYRTTGAGQGGRRQVPAHSYSMDIPRSTNTQQHQQQRQPPVDHKNAENISAESIHRMLGEYTGKTANVKGKPRLRRLMMFPGANKQQSNPQDRIIELSLGGSGLERIAEDEEQHQQNIQRRASTSTSTSTSISNAKTMLVFDEPESVLPPSDRALPGETHPSNYSLSQSKADIAQSRSQPSSVRMHAVDSVALDYRNDAKRFSENSGSTVSSGETLETHNEHDGAAAAKNSTERFPSISRSSNGTPPKRPVSTQVVSQQRQPQKRPPRLSFSNGLQQRPKAIYNDGSSLVPSPTKEHPPKLVPMVHGQVSEKDLVLDPTVYRNTFFNARPLDEQKQLETAVLNRTGRLSSGESTKFLVRSASDDTLNSHGGSTTAVESSGKVRFSGDLDYIPDYYLDPEFAHDADGSAEACVGPEDISTHGRGRGFSSSMPSMASTSSNSNNRGLGGVAGEPADSSDLRRRPSEPTPSSSKAKAKASAVTPAAAASAEKPANSNSASVAEQEVEVLRRTIRILQSRNDMLSELVGLNPLDAVPDHVKTHIRTVELENAWLHRELSKLKQSSLR